MCTLTFAPTEDGYLAGMNRDESVTRPRSLPPVLRHENGLRILHPHEPSGGTWIACNSHGSVLALLNWNDVDRRLLGPKSQTRGGVIPQLIRDRESGATDSHFKALKLDGVFPFRLIGAFLSEKAVVEWRWDGRTTQRLEHPWKRTHWFSSSLSDDRALKARGAVCARAGAEMHSGGQEWLRRLHRSHEPERGAFSICVHRPDASTVSYTEIRCGANSVWMGYISGNPCLKEGFEAVVETPISKRPLALV